MSIQPVSLEGYQLKTLLHTVYPSLLWKHFQTLLGMIIEYAIFIMLNIVPYKVTNHNHNLICHLNIEYSLFQLINRSSMMSLLVKKNTFLSVYHRRQMKVFNVSVHIIEPGFFKTEITNVEHIGQMYRRVYDRCSAEVRAEYGEQYIDQCELLE